MEILKRICLTIIGLAKQIWLIPQSVRCAIKHNDVFPKYFASAYQSR
jgi:hypothetical protein